MREHHVEGVQRARLAADHEPGELRPVDLCLCARRRLHAPTRPQRRSRVGLADEALHRSQAAAVAVLGHQPTVQSREVHRPLAQLRKPVIDRRAMGVGEPPLPGASVTRTTRLATQVVSNGSFAERKLADDRALGQALAGQGLDGHAYLQIGDRQARLRLRVESGRDY